MPPRVKLTPEQVANLINVSRVAGIEPKGNELLGGNEGQRRASSSLFDDLFDLLSRPARASAGAIYNATDEDPNTSALGGLWGGLSGNMDKSYSDVIHNVAPGLPGPVKAVAGFAGDVLLDPLTYVGVKNLKGTSLPEARIRAVGKLAGTGQEVTESAVANTAKILAAADPSRSYVTFAGQKISPEFTRPAEVGNKVKDRFLGEEGDRRLLAKLFSRKAELPFGMAESSRVWEASHAAKFGPHQKMINDLFNRLNPEQQRLVVLGIEQDKDLSNVPLIGDAAKYDGRYSSLEDYRQLAKEEFKRFFDEEMALGLYKPEDFNPNYVLKYFRKGVPESMPGLPAGARRKGGRVDHLADLKELYSIEGAERAGLHPVNEIAEMMSMRAAKHYRTMGRQQFVKAAIKKFGVKMDDQNKAYLETHDWQRVGGSLNAAVSNADEVKDLFLPKNIIKAINGTEEVLKDGQIGSQFARWYDDILNKWKKFNTSYNFGYHVRNSFSDGMINYIDGVRNPSLYDRSIRTIISVTNDLEPEDLLGRRVIPKNLPKIRVGGINLSTKELWDLYLEAGSKSGYITTDLASTMDPLVRKGVAGAIEKNKRVIGKGLRTVDAGITDLADKREDVFRLAHHIKVMEEYLPKNIAKLNPQQQVEALKAASMKAGGRVRKFNIDYGQLSTFERNAMRRVIPFYGWMRRNLPLQIELLFTKPGFMATYPKGQDLLQGILGSDNGEGDWMIPKWVRDLAPARLAEAKNEDNIAQNIIKKLAGAKEGEAVFTNLASSLMPVGDLETILEPLAKGIETGSPAEGIKEGFNKLANMSTPVAKGLFEAGTGRSTFTGQKIDDWTQWIASQTGPSRTATNVLKGDPRYATSWLAGISLQPITAERQEGEWRRREDVLQNNINRQQRAGLKELGLDNELVNDPDIMNKYRNLDIARLQAYIAHNNRIMKGYAP